MLIIACELFAMFLPIRSIELMSLINEKKSVMIHGALNHVNNSCSAAQIKVSFNVATFKEAKYFAE